MSVDESSVKKFIDEMLKEYKRSTPIGNIFKRQRLVHPPRADTKHVTHRVALPKDPFVPGSGEFLRDDGTSFGKDPCTAERLHLLNEIKGADGVETTDLDSISHNGINDLFKEVYAPTDLFLPMESEHFQLAAEDLNDPQRFEFLTDTIPIHWVSSEDFDQGLLLNGERITVGQVEDDGERYIPMKGTPIPEYSTRTKGENITH